MSAEQGFLTYGKFGDVYEMKIQPAVLELRLHRTVQYPDGDYKIRLYFNEPANRPNTLVAARLRAKPANETGLRRQNEHIKDSYLHIKKFLGLD